MSEHKSPAFIQVSPESHARDRFQPLAPGNLKAAIIEPEQVQHGRVQKLTTRQVEDVLESKRKWISQSLAEWQDLNADRIQRDYVNG